jgi:hypothetical protein
MSTHLDVNPVAPDAVAAAIVWLRDKLSSLLPADHISVDLRNFEQGDTWLTVSNPAGGYTPNSDTHFHITRVDINAYAPDKLSAHLLARTAIARLQDMWGHTFDDGVCGKVKISVDPCDQTDQLSQNPRFTAEVFVWMRPLRPSEQ